MPKPTQAAPNQTSPAKSLEAGLDQIQGNILGGFNKDYQAFLFLKVTDPKKAKSWLGKVVREVATAREVRDFDTLFKSLNARRGGELGVLKATWMNLAFTYQGLKELGATELDRFPEAFRQGMAKRAAILGDSDKNAPKSWVAPMGDQNQVHALMIVASDSQEDLGENVLRYVHNMSVLGGMQLVYLQEGAVRLDEPGHEHFGFRDGVSQPGVRHFDAHVAGGEPIQGNPGQDRLHAGEFILGYPTQLPFSKQCTDAKGNAVGEAMDPNPDEGPISPAHEASPIEMNHGIDRNETAPAWACDGSYLVFRRLAQNVEGFHSYMGEMAAKMGTTVSILGAKVVGRYATGAPLGMTKDRDKNPQTPDPALGDPSDADPSILNDSRNNFFEYADEKGENVPRSAHIRKAYPRNEPTDTGGESDTQTHRLMRRGIPFGTSFRPSLGAAGHGGKFGVEEPGDRGLLFLAYQSSIERQFEFVQSRWVNPATFPNLPQKLNDGKQDLDDGEDPLIAPTDEGPFTLTMNKQSPHKVMMKHFVTMTGGDYFFQPSIAALHTLTGSPPQAPEKADVDDEGDVDAPGFDPCASATAAKPAP